MSNEEIYLAPEGKDNCCLEQFNKGKMRGSNMFVELCQINEQACMSLLFLRDNHAMCVGQSHPV